MPRRLLRRSVLPLSVFVALLLPSTTGAAKQIYFELPWTAGQTWRYVGGPHSTLGCPDNGFNCRGGKPWNSLDFSGGDGIVRAAAPGKIEGTTSCPARNSNFLIINHGNGWHTTYYHLVDVPPRLTPGQSVKAGEKLGHTSTKTGCDGHADGPHVHFSIARYSGGYSWHGGRVDLNGFQIGSWVFHDGRTQYSGCATNVVNDQKVCPGGLLKNGTVFHFCQPGNLSPVVWLKASGVACAKARSIVDEWGKRTDCQPNGTVCKVENFTCDVPSRSSTQLHCRAGVQLIVGRLGSY